MLVKVNCHLAAAKQTQKGSYRCVMLTDNAEAFTTFIKEMNDDIYGELAEIRERTFAIPDDTVLFYRKDDE